MMGKENSNKSRRITLRMTPQEYREIENRFKKSTCRKLSEYARNLLFNKPITTHYRNQSLDDFMEEMILLRNELSAIGNNVNQVVKKLNTVQETPEFRDLLMYYERQKRVYFQKVDDIQNHIHKITNKWLQ